MNCLTVENVSKAFGDHVLFEEISLQINIGEKVGLIARNGSGKTTLLNMIAGKEKPEGTNPRILINRNIRLAYATQTPHLSEEMTILDGVLEIDLPKFRAYKALLEAQAGGDGSAIKKAAIAMDDHRAWSLEAQIFELFDKLGLTDLDKPLGILSGGQKKRVSLGLALLTNPDFLILDEPTNHLDIEMIEWLEGYLSKPGLTLLMVTHDRYFLDRICSKIYEIERQTLYTYRGGYSDYVVKKAALQEQVRTTVERTRKLLRKEMEWLNRMPKARGTKAKARIHSIEDMQSTAAQKIYEEPLEMIVQTARLGSKILEMRHVSKRYDALILLDDFSYKFKKYDRVGLFGPNGVGKSTFLHILTGALRPDSGKVVTGSTVQFGIYGQQGLQLENDRRIIDIVRDIAEYLPVKGGQKISAETLLERFLFPRSKQQVYYSQLSGGEKRRVYLLTVLMANPNFLILDEPTNDLDILTLNVLEAFLLNFEGCLVVVSHDRFMLDKLVEHLFVFEGQGRIRDYPGGYTAYREKILAQKAAGNENGIPSSDNQESSGKAHFEMRKQLRRLEKKLGKLEDEKSGIHERFSDSTLPLDEVQTLHDRLKILEEEIEQVEAEWMALAEKIG